MGEHDGVATGPDWRARLRERGQRLTPQRERVADAVAELRHATADDVLAHVQAADPDTALNLSTVYRSLEVLEELGAVRHVHLTGRAPTYHAVGGPGEEHFHAVCRSCERVVTLDVDLAAPLLQRLREEHGFDADATHLTVFGTCREDCR